ncbi:MAG: hypothetical protein HN356_14790 [Calditrichaeota bacterium]|nr:hypothetical protein [Calditrichota bacterium]
MIKSYSRTDLLAGMTRFTQNHENLRDLGSSRSELGLSGSESALGRMSNRNVRPTEFLGSIRAGFSILPGFGNNES